MDKNSFGKTLKELRTDRKIGQIELSKKLGVTSGMISNWENGVHEPKLSNLIAIADFFDVSIDYLAGRVDY